MDHRTLELEVKFLDLQMTNKCEGSDLIARPLIKNKSKGIKNDQTPL
jgi:hypothetical protein